MGGGMPIVHVRHVTTYRYREAVGFGEHRIMLRPRDDDDQRIIAADLTITPAPSRLEWRDDAFGNHVAIAQFSACASELNVESRVRVDHAPSDFRAAAIAEEARTWPFFYPAGDCAAVAPFLGPGPRHPRLLDWVGGLAGAGQDTHALLIDITRTIRRTFRHVARHQKGTQQPAETLALGSGACRDLAVLMIATLRSLGIAARFVSGYLNLGDDGEPQTGGNTHAWVQAHIPGPGWIDFDPSGGTVGNRNLVRVAVAHGPRDAIPLQGV
jgi:transglutaminase-like putative cysteine protease